jgi:type IX secretion system PorP/SprF family membrane protein
MISVKPCLFFLLCLLSAGSYAQDITNFSQFFINPYSINPSYAGIEGRPAMFLGYRKQWADIEGAPTTSSFSFHAPTTFGLNYGLNLSNQTAGILNTSAAMVTLGYSLAMDKHNFIRFAISGGAAYNGIDLSVFDELTDPDPVAVEALDKNMYLIGNAGISFHFKSVHFGASIPTMFTPAYVSKDAFSVTEVKPFQSLIIHASNRFYFAKDKHVFEPYLVYRMNQDLPSQMEAAAVVHLNHVLWFGGSYKQDFGISALGGLKIQNFFLIGGSYSLKNTGMNELNSPSFEIQLSYIFGAKKKDIPVYSFVNTVKEKEKKKAMPPARPSAPIIAGTTQPQQTQQKPPVMPEVQTPPAQQQQQTKPPVQQPEQKPVTPPIQQPEQKQVQQQPTQPIVQQQPPPVQQVKPPVQQPEQKPVQQTPPVVVTQQPAQQVTTQPPVQQAPPKRHDGGPRLKTEVFSIDIPAYDTARHEEEARLSRLDEHSADPDEHHGDDPDAHANSERHEYARRGSTKEDLKPGDYVVAGVFKTSSSADRYADGLNKLGFKAEYARVSEKNMWCVYIVSAKNINEAKAERDNFRKMKIFRDAWLLTVTE